MVTIKFSTANEAFNVPGPEIARILRELASIVDGEDSKTLNGWEHRIQDVNGNTVGQFKYTEV